MHAIRIGTFAVPIAVAAAAAVGAVVAVPVVSQPDQTDQTAGAPPRSVEGRAAAVTPAGDEQPAAEPSLRNYGFFSGSYDRALRPEWDYELEANVWYVSPGGDISIGGSPKAPTASLNVDSPRAAPLAEIHARFDPYTVSFRGSLLDVDGVADLTGPLAVGPVAFAAGETVNANYRLDTADVRVGRRVYQFDGEPNERGRPLLSSGVTLEGGLRIYDASVGVIGPSGSAGASFTHLEPVVGVTAELGFADRYQIQLQNSFGGIFEIDGQDSYSVDIQVSFKYRPVDNASIQLGYRIRRNVLEGDDYELDGAVAGLFAGLSLRF